MSVMDEVGVVHLVRACNGVEPLQRFLDSYVRYPAGFSHELLFILKGFRGGVVPPEIAMLLDRVPHRTIAVADRGFDIEPYRAAALQLRQQYVCFFNSFSEILAEDWLEKLHRHAAGPGVGIAGATGSWESLLSTYESSCRERQTMLPHKRVLRGMELRRLRDAFPPFPNPHLRTNAFCIRRDLFVEAVGNLKIRDKMAAHRFESGRDGLNGRILSKGLSLLVVGRDGTGFTAEQWPQSLTFRFGNQENLLVADNRTRHYEVSGESEKSLLRSHAWGMLAQ